MVLVCTDHGVEVNVRIPGGEIGAPLVLHWRIARALRSELLSWGL